MPTRFDLTTASLADINAAFDAGALTSERLVQMYLDRIEAYDHAGPQLNAVLALNGGALATARALDAERRAQGPRSPLHGIPVLEVVNNLSFDRFEDTWKNPVMESALQTKGGSTSV